MMSNEEIIKEINRLLQAMNRSQLIDTLEHVKEYEHHLGAVPIVDHLPIPDCKWYGQ